MFLERYHGGAQLLDTEKGDILHMRQGWGVAVIYPPFKTSQCKQGKKKKKKQQKKSKIFDDKITGSDGSLVPVGFLKRSHCSSYVS